MDQAVSRFTTMFGCAVALGLCFAWSAPVRAQEDPADWEAVIERLTKEVRRTAMNDRLVRQLAVAHNNLAVDLAAQGKWEPAQYHLEEALSLDGESGEFQKNLGSVHLGRAFEEHAQRRDARALEHVRKAIDADPRQATAYILLGDLEYDAQRLNEAREAWLQAQALDPGEPKIQERLARLGEELPVEGSFGKISQAHFDLRYEDASLRSVGFDLRSALLEARRVIGSDFGYWPSHKTVVLIYSAESFRSMRKETPEWLAGQYDGKIRVPLPGGDVDLVTVKQTLFHEYTHALIHELTRGQCPIWLNEGLAQHQGARYGIVQKQFLKEAFEQEALVSWDRLDGFFSSRLALPQVALGYQQAHSIVEYLIDRYGFWRMRKILEALKEGQSLPEILQRITHRSPEHLESDWREWLPRYLGIG